MSYEFGALGFRVCDAVFNKEPQSLGSGLQGSWCLGARAEEI